MVDKHEHDKQAREAYETYGYLLGRLRIQQKGGDPMTPSQQKLLVWLDTFWTWQWYRATADGRDPKLVRREQEESHRRAKEEEAQAAQTLRDMLANRPNHIQESLLRGRDLGNVADFIAAMPTITDDQLNLASCELIDLVAARPPRAAVPE